MGTVGVGLNGHLLQKINDEVTEKVYGHIVIISSLITVVKYFVYVVLTSRLRCFLLFMHLIQCVTRKAQVLAAGQVLGFLLGSDLTFEPVADEHKMSTDLRKQKPWLYF